MQTQTLKVAHREARGKGAARKLRAAGRIPGVVYGEGEAQSVDLDRKSFDLLLRAGGHHGLLDLAFESGQETVKALVRDVQVHPVSREVVHVDLQRVSLRQKVRIEVPVVLVGKPEGVKNQGGILEHNLRQVEVECLPMEIPDKIEVDVSQLLVGQALHVSDLAVPNVTFVAHPETTIALVSLPAAERAVEEAAVETAAAVEAASTEGEAKPGAEKEAEKAEKSPKGARDTKDARDAKGGKS